MSSFLKKYYVAASIYGAVHKISILNQATIDAYVPNPSAASNALFKEKKIQRPMLLGEKITAFTVGVIISPCFAPFWISDHLNRLDLLVRDKKAEEYGYSIRRTILLDYIFT